MVRLGTVGADGVPHLVPMTFAVAGDEIVSAVDAKPKRTRRLRRLANIEANPAVCVLADVYDEDWDALWWVRADGLARVDDDPATLRWATGLLAARYPQYREARPAGPVVVVRVTAWRGWSAR